MIDQHAAHEKILFEKYLNQIENGSLIVQPLLIPTIVDLTIDDYASYEENDEVFRNAGFTLEEFGGTSLTLKEVPYFLGKLFSSDTTPVTILITKSSSQFTIPSFSGLVSLAPTRHQ